VAKRLIDENIRWVGGYLAPDRVDKFAYLFTPLRLKGATGSPGNRIAVV
jgi:hypothetical protein